jgi:hypothetical protein
MKIKKPYAMMIIFVLFLSGVGFGADASMKDDAFHYMKNDINDQIYNEWWYFNVVSNESQLFIVYLISDPDNLTLSRKIQVHAVVMEDDKPAATGIQKSRGFGGDLNSPTFDIDKSGFSSQEDASIKVWGDVNDISTNETISWDLNYQPAVSPWFAIPVQAQVGSIKGGWMKWLAYIPSANVTGTLTLGNRTLDIKGVGYHDHAWGRWALNDPKFAWAQVSIPKDDFSLTIGDILENPQSTYLGMKYGGETITFSARQIKLIYTDYTFDNATARIYPSGYLVMASNGDYKLETMIKVQKNVPLVMDYPMPMPSYLIYGQVSDFKGTLKSKSGDEYKFEERGFSGYTTHKLHPIYGMVGTTNASNINITATNERTGQKKIELTSSEGWFSFDADYLDYLTNSTAPWVADGDRVKLEISNGARKGNSTVILVSRAESKQEANLSQ